MFQKEMLIKVNRGPSYDTNVLLNRLSGKKLHQKIFG